MVGKQKTFPVQNIEIAINFAMHLPFNVLHKCNVINFNASLNRNMFYRETNIAPMYIYIYIYIYDTIYILCQFYRNSFAQKLEQT